MAVTERARLVRLAVPERLSAFGLDLRLAGANGRVAAVGARSVRWELAAPAVIDRGWGTRAATLVDFRYEDGRQMMRVDHHAELGYRILAPRFGRHLVSDDGRRIVSALPALAPWRWQRLFYAQVLPLAAALQGLELFHASAVRLGEGAVAFVAASGTGKTSVAAHLVAAGAPLVTDDVLALERVGPRVRAHPGAGMMSLDPAELAAMTPAGRERLGAPMGHDDKVHLAARPVEGPLPLRALYFLRRPADGPPELAISRHDEPPTKRLLASGFLVYLRPPERLVTHLDVCASLVRSVPTFDVAMPANVPAADAAQAIALHAEQVSG